MSKDKKKNNNNHSKNPQILAKEAAATLIKRFIDDINHDPAFRHRTFYPVLYDKIVSGRPHITGGNGGGQQFRVNMSHEYHFYLFKSEELATHGAVMLAMLLSNGPLLPENERLTLEGICDRRNRKNVISRTMMFMHLLKDKNLYNFVFANIDTEQYNIRGRMTKTGIDQIREKFSSLVKKYQAKAPDIKAAPIATKIDIQINQYLSAYYEHITRKDVEATVDFLNYMANSKGIVTDFNYRPMTTQELNQFLSYNSDIPSKITDNIDARDVATIVENYVVDFAPILLRLYADAVTGRQQNRGSYMSFSIIQNYNINNSAFENQLKHMAATTANKMGIYTKNYLQNTLFNLDEKINSDPIATIFNDVYSDPSLNFDDVIKKYYSMDAFLSEYESQKQHTLGYTIGRYLEIDANKLANMSTLGSRMQHSDTINSNDVVQIKMVLERILANIGAVGTLLNMPNLYKSTVLSTAQQLPNNNENHFIQLLKQGFNTFTYLIKSTRQNQKKDIQKKLEESLKSMATAVAGIYHNIENESDADRYIYALKQIYDKSFCSNLNRFIHNAVEPLYLPNTSANEKQEVRNSLESICSDLSKLQGITVDTTTIVRDGLRSYYNFVIYPSLNDLLAQLADTQETRMAVDAEFIQNDVLGLSQLIRPENAGVLTWDGAVFNDLAYYTYVFMSDTLAGMQSDNIDMVMKELDSVYGLRYFSNAIVGREKVYFYLRYIGVPQLYRGAKTVLSKADLYNNYKFITDPRNGLYKQLGLRQKKPQNNH